MKVIFILCVISIMTLTESKSVINFSTGNRIFTSDLYQEQKKNETGNFLVSPFSADIALALTQSGARGKSAEEIRKSLHLPNSDEEIQEDIRSMLESIKSFDANLQLHAANKIYVKKNLPLKTEFKNIATKVYDADIEPIDFSQKLQAANIVNTWVQKQTQNKIQNLLQPSDLSISTAAVLVNALYFRGRWLKEFQPTATKKANFFKTKTESVQVDTMYKYESLLNYCEDKNLNAKFVKLSLKGGDASMVFVLPNEKDGLTALENKHEIFIEQDFQYTPVNLAIPKFKIESKIDLKKLLKNLGVEQVFTSEADLSGMAGEPGDLVVDKIIQKTFIDVNEEGVEAAAATAVLPLLGSAFIRDPPKDFIADHPFIFYINVNGVVLFAGRVVDPTK